MKYFVSIAIVFFISQSSFAQSNSKLVTGMIVSSVDNRPLEGAAVRVKGTKNCSGSQPDGIYYISIQKTDSILVFSYEGYVPTEVSISGESEYNVTLRKTPGTTSKLSAVRK